MNALRPLLRLAWREVTGQKARTALVVGLVTLMVGTAVAAGTIARTTTSTDQDFITSEFAGADAIVHIESEFFVEGGPRPIDEAVPNLEVPQRLTEQQIAGIVEAAEDTLGVSAVEARSAWLAETLEPSAPFRTSGTESLNVAALDLANPIFEPRYELLQGRNPEALDEVALTPRALSQSDTSVGETISIWDQEFTIVGEIARTGSSYRGVAIITPETFDALEIDPAVVSTEVLLAGTDPTDLGLNGDESFRRRDAIQRTIAAAADVPFESFWMSVRSEEVNGFGFREGFVDAGRPEQLSTLVAALFAVQVALVAAAAFAVGVARRTRQFGQLQATGASNPQLQQVVLIEAAAKGLIGAGLGTTIGFGVTVLAWRQGWLDTFGDRFPIDVRWSLLDLLGPLIVGVGSAVVAAWWPTRRLRNLAPASALADHVPISRPTPRTPIIGLFALVGGTFLLIAVTSTEFVFNSGDIGVLLVAVAVLAMFGGALASIGMLIHKIGERADGFNLLGRIVARNSARHQARSWVAVAALVAVVILPVVLGSSTKAFPTSFASGADHSSWVQLRVFDNFGATDTQPFFAQLDDRVEAELGADEHFVAVFEQPQFIGENMVANDYFTMATSDSSDPFIEGVGLQTVRGTTEVLEAASLDPNLWTTPDAPEVVIVSGVRHTPSDFDGELVRGNETFSFTVAEPAPFLSYDAWAVVSPDVEQRLDLDMRPDLLLVDAGAPATIEDEVALAEIANDVWAATLGPEASSAGVDGWISADRGVSGPTAAQTAWLAIGGFTILAIIISLVTSSLAAVEVDKEIATMIAAGAAPSMRRKLLGAQTAYHLFVAAAIGIPLAILIFWAATRGDEASPQGLTFPWTSMAMMGIVVPLVVGAAVAALFRNGQPAVSRRT